MLLFAHRLALKLGMADVEEITALPRSKFVNWMAFEYLEPFGYWQDCLLHRFAPKPLRWPAGHKRRFLTSAEMRRRSMEAHG